MKALSLLMNFKKKNTPKTISEYRQEMVGKLAEEQFKKLSKLGLTVPVALL